MADATKSVLFPTCGEVNLQHGTVHEITKNADLVLQDETVLKLADLHFMRSKASGEIAHSALLRLDREFNRQDVFYLTIGRKDRYGRRNAYIFKPSQPEIESAAQFFMIDDHHVHFLPSLIKNNKKNNHCSLVELRNHLQKLDNEALQSTDQKGIVYNAKDERLWQMEGEFAVIQGSVTNTKQTSKGLLLNFGENWQRDFTASLSDEVITSTFANAKTVSNLVGQQIELRGFLDLYNGPNMRIDHPMQVKLLNQ